MTGVEKEKEGNLNGSQKLESLYWNYNFSRHFYYSKLNLKWTLFIYLSYLPKKHECNSDFEHPNNKSPNYIELKAISTAQSVLKITTTSQLLPYYFYCVRTGKYSLQSVIIK